MATDTGRISYQPSAGLSYDPEEPVYWDPASLNPEIERAFEICHGCRMCFKYCDSFPHLFKLIDEQYDGDVTRLNENDVGEVMGACFQCKLCEVQCPYTPRDGHEFQLDFPKLVHRYQAQKAKVRVKSVRDRVLGDPDGAAKLARLSLGTANVLNRSRIHRFFMEKTLGIHRDKELPDFSAHSFESLADSRGKCKEDPAPETVLFQTCYIHNNEPDIGLDTLEVLERNSIRCNCVKGLQCCGMPSWEQGDLSRLRKQAKHNLELLLPFVEKGAKVLVINPTCAMMMKREYQQLLEMSARDAAKKVAEAVMSPSDYLWSIRKEDRFNRDFKSTPGERIAYHAPCHLRALGTGLHGRDLLRMIPGVKPQMTMECCGHDGTYAMKFESFEASKRIGEKAFNSMRDKDAAIWSTDCPLAAIQFSQHAGKKAMHPLSVLARAYRENGFPLKIEPEAKGN